MALLPSPCIAIVFILNRFGRVLVSKLLSRRFADGCRGLRVFCSLFKLSAVRVAFYRRPLLSCLDAAVFFLARFSFFVGLSTFLSRPPPCLKPFLNFFTPREAPLCPTCFINWNTLDSLKASLIIRRFNQIVPSSLGFFLVLLPFETTAFRTVISVPKLRSVFPPSSVPPRPVRNSFSETPFFPPSSFPLPS